MLRFLLPLVFGGTLPVQKVEHPKLREQLMKDGQILEWTDKAPLRPK